MRKFLFIFSLFLFGCIEADIDPCSQVEVGISEEELIKALGKPLQSSDEGAVQKALIFKGNTIPSMMVVELEQKEENQFKVAHCYVM